MNRFRFAVLFALLIVTGFVTVHGVTDISRAAQESGAVGIQGTIPSPPPTVGATISVPSAGASFTTLPINVSGLCPSDLLVKMFKNGVFAGSTQCSGGSFSISVDLFSGSNELIARVYDALDQAGPDSNTVNVTYIDNSSNADIANRVILTTNFAKRGANPGETLSWPLLVSGGFAPYAVSVEWGDGETSLSSVGFPTEFFVEHKYQNSGIYRVTVKAVDSKDTTAYLQLVAVANGPLSQQTTGEGGDAATEGEATGTKKTIILWQPLAILLPFLIATFWLGKRYEVKHIRRNVEQGKRPF